MKHRMCYVARGRPGLPRVQRDDFAAARAAAARRAAGLWVAQLDTIPSNYIDYIWELDLLNVNTY